MNEVGNGENQSPLRILSQDAEKNNGRQESDISDQSPKFKRRQKVLSQQSKDLSNLTQKRENANPKSIVKQNDIRAKYTIDCTGNFYQVWNIINILACLTTTSQYPFYTVNSLPKMDDFGNPALWLLLWAETVCALDMIVHFLLQEANEEGGSKQEELSVVATKYFKGAFKWDLFIFFPWGFVFSQFDKRLKFLWVTKGLRIFTLNYYLSDEMLIPVIDQMFDKMRQHAIQDPILREDIYSDHIFNYEQILVINTIKIIRQFLRILAIAYYIGQYWFVMAAIYYEFKFNRSTSDGNFSSLSNNFVESYGSYIHYKDNWSILSASPGKRALINTYFSMTSLSTIGFGDYYPVSDMERLCCAFILLFGVALFSLFMGQLLEMIDKIKSLDDDFSEEDKLEQFFALLRDQFNTKKPLEREFHDSITNFMSLTWQNNRNNFLLSETDMRLFDQLYPQTQIALYKDFIFKEFLYMFRRFFNFRIALVQKQADLKNKAKAINSEQTQFMNPNIIKLRKKVKQMMLIRRQMSTGTDNTGGKQWTKEEILDDIERIKIRLDNIEKKNMAKKEKQQLKLRYRKEYGKGCGSIPFPFMTFENDDRYAKFMTLILRSLEARFIMQGDIIHKELDECLEVLFVLEGKYAIGYEINNVRRFRKQFGPSTIIGGYNMSFQKRFFFFFLAHTNMVCYSIRRQQWKDIMDEFPELYRIVKLKSFHFYFNQIYRPMLRMKMIDIQSMNMRNDYNQVLAVTSDSFQEIKSSIHKIFSEQEQNMKELSLKLVEEKKINWLLQKIEQKLSILSEMFIDITYKQEFIQVQLWKKVIHNIAHDLVKDPIEYTKKINNIIFPRSLDYDDHLNVAKAFQFELMMYKLKKNIHGPSKFWDIKEDSKKKQIDDYMKEFVQNQLKNQLNSMYQQNVISQMKQEFQRNKQRSRLRHAMDSGDISKKTSIVESGQQAHRDNSNQKEQEYFENVQIEEQYNEYLNKENSFSVNTTEFNHSLVSQQRLITNNRADTFHDGPSQSANRMRNKVKRAQERIVELDYDMIGGETALQQETSSQNQPQAQRDEQTVIRQKKQKKTQQIMQQPQSQEPRDMIQRQKQNKSRNYQSTRQNRRQQLPSNEFDELDSQNIPMINMNDLGNIDKQGQHIVIDQSILGQSDTQTMPIRDPQFKTQNSQQTMLQQQNYFMASQSGSKRSESSKPQQIIEIVEDVPVQFQTKTYDHNLESNNNDSDLFEEQEAAPINSLDFADLTQQAIILTPKNESSNNHQNDLTAYMPASQNYVDTSERNRVQEALNDNQQQLRGQEAINDNEQEYDGQVSGFESIGVQDQQQLNRNPNSPREPNNRPNTFREQTNNQATNQQNEPIVIHDELQSKSNHTDKTQSQNQNSLMVVQEEDNSAQNLTDR